MLTAALPLFEIESDHDTEADLARDELVTRTRKPRPARAPREVAEVREISTVLPMPKRPISASEQLRGATVTRLQVREAVVKRMSAAQKNQEPKVEKSFRVADVRIDWLRGPRSLKIARDGADGFTLEGVATESSRISLGIDGLIFSVNVEPGESAATALDKLSRRLNLGYQVEVLESTPARAAARVSSHT